jgi:hypothetical protein
VEPAETVLLTLSSHAAYSLDAAASSGTVTIADNDVGGINVSPTAGLTTSETGTTATFDVTLTAQPSANVVVPIASDDTTEGTVRVSSLTFTPTNWNVPQTVIVTGVDDLLTDGDITYRVTVGPSASTVPGYSGLRGTTVTIVNRDFVIDIDLARGTVRFPNKYTDWTVGGAAGANYVAVPSGWTVAGSAGTNYVALPPGWTAGGAGLSNYVALPPGWTVGGAPGTNYVAVPPGWTTGGAAGTNYVTLPPGWTVGGVAGTNYVTVPPGWTASGAPGTNYVALRPGWTRGGAAGMNYTALPPGWTVGGSATMQYVAVAPDWIVGGAATTNFVTYPSNTVTTLEFAFDDPGFLALFQYLRTNRTMSDSAIADLVVCVHNYVGVLHGAVGWVMPSGLW